MPTIQVDGVSYEVREGTNLLQACLSHGLDLPYFCWHPAMGSVGACRQCAVMQYRDDDDASGKITMACMTPVADGARLSIATDEAVRFRASVIEWLMLNHPHDCPVCEEGGECHLQDMTVMTGHTFRRYRGSKRTFRNQYLGPFLNHEMNRCITCYRCVRFYRDYAGGTDLDAFGSRDRLYFGRASDGVLESEFAGNLVEVCPTGVFTDKTFSARYTRKWDLTSAPSVCHGCGLGCNTLPGERYGLLKRVHNRYHHEINGYFLCDRGRFGAGFVNSERRVRSPGARCEDGSFDALGAADALQRAARAVAGGRLAGIGSPRASLESNFALMRLVGEENFSSGLSDHDTALLAALARAAGTEGIRVPTLSEVESADAVLVLGEDVSNSAPRLALALRQAARNRSFELAREAGIPTWQDAGVRGHAGARRTPVFIASVLPTRLDDVSRMTTRGAPSDLAAVGETIAHDLTTSGAHTSQLDAAAADFVATAVAALAKAKRPLVVSGTGTGSTEVISAAAAIAAALAARGGQPLLQLNVPECNSLGALLLGGAPVERLLDRLEGGDIDTLVVLENDLARRAPRERLERALGDVCVIALDSLENWTLEQSQLVLPAATFAESDGTWINNEGRAQRFYRVFPAAHEVEPSWLWLARTAAAAGGAFAARLAFEHVDELTRELAGSRPGLATLVEAGAGPRSRPLPGTAVPRQPHRYSGRTAMNAHHSVHEPKTPLDRESPLAFSMEGQRPRDPGALLPYVWAPGWNSNQSIFKFQSEVAGPLRGGPAGVRLPLGPAAAGADEPRPEAPPARQAGELTAVPLQEVFASDELSWHAPAVRERAPDPYVVLAPADAGTLGLGAGDGVRVRLGDGSASFTARLDPAMRPGSIGMVQGMTGGLYFAPGDPVRAEPDPAYRRPLDQVIARG